MDWSIASPQSCIPEAELPELHQKAVELLDLLQKTLPDNTGENSPKGRWIFQKTHSILHKVHEILLCGNRLWRKSAWRIHSIHVLATYKHMNSAQRN
jgi:hypothetical protein